MPTQVPDSLLDSVLVALGLTSRPRQDLEGLRSVYDAWCRGVPFDNVRKLRHMRSNDPGPLPGDDPVEFFEAWLASRTGGTCWAANGALDALLSGLGFDAVRGIATMEPGPDVMPNHGTVIVECSGQRYLADASILHAVPLLLAPDPTDIEHPAWGVRCAPGSGTWTIEWRPLHTPDRIECRIDEIDVGADRFHQQHERTRGRSPFNHVLAARLNRGETVIGIGAGRSVRIEASGRLRSTPLDAESRATMLEELGITPALARALPADQVPRSSSPSPR